MATVIFKIKLFDWRKILGPGHKFCTDYFRGFRMQNLHIISFIFKQRSWRSGWMHQEPCNQNISDLVQSEPKRNTTLFNEKFNLKRSFGWFVDLFPCHYLKWVGAIKKNQCASTRQSAMIATHVAVEAVVAVIQIATLLVQQSTSVGGCKSKSNIW